MSTTNAPQNPSILGRKGKRPPLPKADSRAVAPIKEGITRGIGRTTLHTRLPGRSVRATSQAIVVPSTMQDKATLLAMASEFVKGRSVRGLVRVAQTSPPRLKVLHRT